MDNSPHFRKLRELIIMHKRLHELRLEITKFNFNNIHMKFYLAIFCSVITFFAFSCASRTPGQPGSIPEGIKGRVSVQEGNMMPGPGKKNDNTNNINNKKDDGKRIQCTVYIYAVTTGAQAEGEGPLYKAIHQPLVAKVKTDAKGFFQCKLAPGTYSVFTGEENGQFFASLSNGKGELNPVEVVKGKVTVCDIVVNHRAVY